MTFTYDALNRMTTATWHDGSQTKYTFDAAQRITQAQEFEETGRESN